MLSNPHISNNAESYSQLTLNGKLVFSVDQTGAAVPCYSQEQIGDIILSESLDMIVTTTRGKLLGMNTFATTCWETQHKKNVRYNVRTTRNIVPIFDAIDPHCSITENGQLNHMHPDDCLAMGSSIPAWNHSHGCRYSRP